MKSIPTSRISQAVASTLIAGLGHSLFLTKDGDAAIDTDDVPLDVVYSDDVPAMSKNARTANARCMAVAKDLAAYGLPTVSAKNEPSKPLIPYGIIRGLSLWKDGVLAPRPAALQKLPRATYEILAGGVVSPAHLSSVIGSWVACCL